MKTCKITKNKDGRINKIIKDGNIIKDFVYNFYENDGVTEVMCYMYDVRTKNLSYGIAKRILYDNKGKILSIIQDGTVSKYYNVQYKNYKNCISYQNCRDGGVYYIKIIGDGGVLGLVRATPYNNLDCNYKYDEIWFNDKNTINIL